MAILVCIWISSVFRSVVKLANGLTALLISDANNEQDISDDAPGDRYDNDVEMTDVTENSSPGTDSDGSRSESESDSSDSASSVQDFAGESQSIISKKKNFKKLAAVAICIGVGSFSDPADLPGLAHLLEHLVFMGSKKYRKETGFDEFVKAHGGKSDAFTECEKTVFSLDVDPKFLEEALKRITRFFIDPLLKTEAIAREIDVIQKEFQKVLSDDGPRLEQLLGKLADPSHPMAKFLWGSVETLGTTPKLNGIDVAARLKEFHKQFYIPTNMTLAIQAAESLDDLEEMIVRIFSVIPSSANAKPSFSDLNPPFYSPAFRKIVKVVPMEEISQVILTWSLPSMKSFYGAKPMVYVEWLLGHAGKGTISSYLREKGWIVDLEAGSDESEFHNNSSAYLCQVTITLSQEGLLHVSEVVTVLFEYLLMLRTVGPAREVFDQIKTVADNNFRFTEEVEPQDYVQELSLAMQSYPPKDYLTGDRLLINYDEQLLRDCVNSLTPDKLNVMILSPTFNEDVTCNQQCRWFGTKYSIQDIPTEWVDRWTAVQLNSQLQLPPRNEFLATDFTLKTTDDPQSTIPIMISKSDVVRVWHKMNNRFKVPLVYVYVYLVSECFSRTVTSVCLSDIFVELIRRSLLEVSHDAEEADLSCDVDVENGGILIVFSGYNEKMRIFYEIVMDHIISLQFTDKAFESARDEVKTKYRNHSLKPSHLNKDLRLSLLVDKHWTMTERLSVLPNVTMKDVEDFSQEFLSTTSVKMVVNGNYTAQEVKYLEQWLLDHLPPSSSSSANATQSNTFITEIPLGSFIHRVKNANVDDPNCVLCSVYQHGHATVKQQMLNELMISQMEIPLLDDIRTKQGMCYDIYCSPMKTLDVIGFSVTVHSVSKDYSMTRLNNALERFLEAFEKNIQSEFSEESFKRIVQSYIWLKQQESVNLEDETESNWADIMDSSFAFDSRQREVKELQDLSLIEFKTWCSEHLLASSTRRKLSVQVAATVKRKPVQRRAREVDSKKRVKRIPGGKKKRQHRTQRRTQCVTQPRDRDAVPKSGRDSKGNIYFHDIVAFKASCNKYSASAIV